MLTPWYFDVYHGIKRLSYYNGIYKKVPVYFKEYRGITMVHV